METVYDWMSMAVFAGLVVLFLHRSTSDGAAKDTVLHYLPPALGCAVANYIGNIGNGALSAALLFGVLVYIAYVLRPFNLKL